MRVSLLLGAAVTALLLVSAGCVVLGDEALRAVGIDSGWIVVALTLLFAVVTLLVAYAPADRQPARWVTFGSIVVVAAWAGTSLVLGLYLTSIAELAGTPYCSPTARRVGHGRRAEGRTPIIWMASTPRPRLT